MAFTAVQKFIRTEIAGGVLVMLAAIVALCVENSPLQAYYHHFLHMHIGMTIGSFVMIKPVHLWINDGLMSIFFLLVGLEIKREMLVGELSCLSKSLLPVIGAIGGMLMPALIYFIITVPDFDAMKGWAVPTATDIAFALAILGLLGDRVPKSLKMFVTALAIFDDIGAIAIIAIFYATDISLGALGVAGICVVILMGMNLLNIVKSAPYFIVGALLWFCVLNSGVHATLAGVIVALAIPMRNLHNKSHSPLQNLERDLHPYVAYGIMPLFAFANAGVSLSGFTFESLTHPITLGIIAGLFLGKQLGIFGATGLAVKMGICQMPKGCKFGHLYGGSLLCGVGFTMSLLIGMLAFDLQHPSYSPLMRYGVILGSLLSGCTGYLVLNTMSKYRAHHH